MQLALNYLGPTLIFSIPAIFASTLGFDSFTRNIDNNNAIRPSTKGNNGIMYIPYGTNRGIKSPGKISAI